MFGRGYPADVEEEYRKRGRRVGAEADWLVAGDLDEIAAPIDFLGLNYYTSLSVGAGADETEDTGVPAGADPPPGHTEMGWPITPSALTDFLVRVHEEYGPRSVIVSENGASYSDGADETGRIRDDRRIEYLDTHIGAIEAARRAGAPVDGYFVWSLLDNFEWSLGYTQRFGIVWVDHATGQRIPKDSYGWYRDRIAAGIT